MKPIDMNYSSGFYVHPMWYIFPQRKVSTFPHLPSLCACGDYEEAVLMMSHISVSGVGIGAVHYEPEGCGFDARWCHCDF
jgi:hypothetical protein